VDDWGTGGAIWISSGAVAQDAARKVPKHQVVFDYLHSNIKSGMYPEGDRLPSEAELGEIFHASRITVAKAVLELQRMNLVSRRPGAGPDWEAVWWDSSQDPTFVKRMLDAANPQGIVCANDGIAARAMQQLLALGRRIPEEIRVAGIDDVQYAHLLPVPLTTMHQNCPEIGVRAMETMLARLQHPELPIRDILVPARLIARRSCGAQLPV